jgi:hypothetical protein
MLAQRRARRPRAEALETRQVLASPLLADWPPALVATSGNDTFIQFTKPVYTTNQQSATAAVTLTLATIYPAGAYQVDVSTDPGPGAGIDYVPTTVTVTFAPGQTAATAVFPIIKGAWNPGSVEVPLSLAAANPRSDETIAWQPGTHLTIFASPNAAAPTITSTRLTPAGLQLTFSQPMDPATVTNPRNYQVTDVTGRGTNLGDYVAYAVYIFGGKPKVSSGLVPIRAAVYNPTTLTVTLVPQRKLKIGDVFTVRSRIWDPTTGRTPPRGAGSALRDVTGIALATPGGDAFFSQEGAFSVTVTRVPRNPNA